MKAQANSDRIIVFTAYAILLVALLIVIVYAITHPDSSEHMTSRTQVPESYLAEDSLFSDVTMMES